MILLYHTFSDFFGRLFAVFNFFSPFIMIYLKINNFCAILWLVKDFGS